MYHLTSVPETMANESLVASPPPFLSLSSKEHDLEVLPLIDMANLERFIQPIMRHWGYDEAGAENFIQSIRRTAGAVCRIISPLGLGTGTLLQLRYKDMPLIITNKHIIKNQKTVMVQFDYDADGQLGTMLEADATNAIGQDDKSFFSYCALPVRDPYNILVGRGIQVGTGECQLYNDKTWAAFDARPLVVFLVAHTGGGVKRVSVSHIYPKPKNDAERIYFHHFLATRNGSSGACIMTPLLSTDEGGAKLSFNHCEALFLHHEKHPDDNPTNFTHNTAIGFVYMFMHLRDIINSSTTKAVVTSTQPA